MLHDQLGDWLEWQRRNSRPWIYLLGGATLLMWMLNARFKPYLPGEPFDVEHGLMAREGSLYGVDWVPGFWCVFGLAGYFVLVILLRKFLLPLLLKHEEADRD